MSELELAVLSAAEERFVAYMTERHYHNEDDVLRNLSRLDTPANRLIRAVAEWRKAKLEDPRG